MKHTADYFRDEVRNGFYVPTAIKQAWAVELDILEEIDRICTKYEIQYYADWGTFLGAVRHGGFVPWDDDIDICMKRDDYNRFRKAVQKELPDKFAVYDFETKKDHWLFLARVVNNTRICFDEEHLKKYYNFPWLAGVDIFLLDYLYKDEISEQKRDKEVLKLIALADGIREGKIERDLIFSHIRQIEAQYNVKLSECHDNITMAVSLYGLAQQQMARVLSDESDMVGQIFPWILKGVKGLPKKYYEKAIRLPFEDTTIPVPAYYNEVLSARYWSYLNIYKVWDGHDYPFFETQIKEMERLNGAPFPAFAFDEDMLKRPAPDTRRALKKIAADYLDKLRGLFPEAEMLLCEGRMSDLEHTLIRAQQIAFDVGTLIEQSRDGECESTKAAVGVLETFCEAVYQEFQDIVNGLEKKTLPLFEEALDKVSEVLHKNIIDRREVLFLPVGPREYKGFEDLYARLSANQDTDVYVVPLPLMFKDAYGRVVMTDDEIDAAVHLDEYPDGIKYADWKCYDISQHCPDIVYIQNPYDGQNPCLTVPPVFYAAYIRKYTKQLIYIPFAKTAEFDIMDINDLYNMKHYVTSPGVIYADQVIVQSENIKEQYIRRLTNFAGQDTEAVWRRKVLSADSSVMGVESKSSHKMKRLLYCIGANEMSEHMNCFVNSVKERIRTLEANNEKFCVSIVIYPADRTQWEAVNKELADTFFDVVDTSLLINGFDMKTFFHADAGDFVSAYDAYYGSPSPLVPLFVALKKPVLISDYGL